MAVPFNIDEEYQEMQLIENQEPRCACVLLLDTSSSMQGDRIDEVNKGLFIFKEEMMKDELASLRVQVSTVTFDSQVMLHHPFIDAIDFDPPHLSTRGLTHMGEALEVALDLIEDQKKRYKKETTPYYRPWIVLLTDGSPQGEPDRIVKRAVARIHKAIDDKQVVVQAFGVTGADTGFLDKLVAGKKPKKNALVSKKVESEDIRKVFIWLSRSMKGVSEGKPEYGDDEQEPLLDEPDLG